jgi:hypothetical protein
MPLTANDFLHFIVGALILMIGIILIIKRKSENLQKLVTFVFRGGRASGFEFHVGGVVAIGVIFECVGVFAVLSGAFSW